MNFYEDKIVGILLKCREESEMRSSKSLLTFIYSATLRYSVGIWDRGLTEKTNSED